MGACHALYERLRDPFRSNVGYIETLKALDKFAVAIQGLRALRENGQLSPDFVLRPDVIKDTIKGLKEVKSEKASIEREGYTYPELTSAEKASKEAEIQALLVQIGDLGELENELNALSRPYAV